MRIGSQEPPGTSAAKRKKALVVSWAMVRGMADQAAGAAQDLYGQARDTAADAAVAARDTAASFEKWLRRTIETQPYTTALVAIGIGWLLGRMHRPL